MSDGIIVIDTKVDNSGVEKGVNSLGSIAKVGSKVAIAAVTSISTAVVGMGVAATNVGMNFESSMSQVAATMGITADEIANGSESFEMLEKAAKDAGATTQFSATQSAEALNFLALAGYSAEKSVAALPTVLNLAAAGGLELGYASDLVTDSMSALGLETSELEGFVDQLAKTSQKSNTNIGQLGEAILVVGGTAKVLAGGTVELNTVLGILADNGIKGAEGGTALRNMILSLSAPTDTARKSIEGLGLQVFDAEGNMRPLNDTFNDLNGILSTMTQGEQTQVLSEIFNKTDLKSVNALLANSGERFDELSGYISDCDGAAANMAETMNDNLKGKLTIIGSSMEGLGIQIYEKLEGPLKTAAETAIESLGNLSDSLSNGELGSSIEHIAESFGDLITKLAEGVEVWLPRVIDGLAWMMDHSNEIAAGIIAIGVAMLTMNVASMIMGVVGAFQKAKLITEGLTVSQWLLNLAMTANPIAIVVALIAGLVAGLIYLWNTNDGFRTAITDCWNAVLEAGEACWGWLVKFFTEDIPQAISDMMVWFSELPEKIWGFLTETYEKVGIWAKDMWDKFIEVGSNCLESITTFFKELPGEVWKWITDAYTKVSTWASDMWNKFLEVGKTCLDNIIKFFSELPYEVGRFIGETLAKIVLWSIDMWNKFIETGTNCINAIVTFFSELPVKVYEFILDTYNKVSQWSSDMWNKAIEMGTNFLNNVVTFFKEVPVKIWELITETYNKVSTWATDMWNKALETGRNFINNIISFFSELPGKIWTWLTSTINKTTQFASDMWRSAVDAGTKFVDGLINTISALPGQVWDIGVNIVEGLWNGIMSMGSWISSKISGFFSGIVDGAKSVLGIHSPSRVFRDQVGKQVPAGMVVGIEDGMPEVEKSVKDSFGELVAGVNISDISAKMTATVNHETSKTSSRVQSNQLAKSNDNYDVNKSIIDLLSKNELGGDKSGFTLSIENFVNNREQDVEQLCKELEFYRKRVSY